MTVGDGEWQFADGLFGSFQQDFITRDLFFLLL